MVVVTSQEAMFITHSARLEDNLPLLTEAYGVIFQAFTSLGLVLEHDKSEVFHFSWAHRFSSLPIDRGFALYTGATPLRPKPIWQYLGKPKVDGWGGEPASP
jgi:hypothetical protein